MASHESRQVGMYSSPEASQALVGILDSSLYLCFNGKKKPLKGFKQMTDRMTKDSEVNRLVIGFEARIISSWIGQGNNEEEKSHDSQQAVVVWNQCAKILTSSVVGFGTTTVYKEHNKAKSAVSAQYDPHTQARLRPCKERKQTEQPFMDMVTKLLKKRLTN